MPDKEYYAVKGEKSREQRKNYYYLQKETVIKHYGGECECCGETDHDILTVDHINGDGAEHRKEVPASQIHSWLIKNNFPPGFRLLCFNCNHKSRRVFERTGRPLATIRNLQREIKEWADSVYPNRTTDSIIKKLEEERKELMDSGHLDPMEYADVAILVLDLASLNGVDVQDAVRKKLCINYTRSWLIDPDTGVLSHDRSTDTPQAAFPFLDHWREWYDLGKHDAQIGQPKRTDLDREAQDWYDKGYDLGVGDSD